jgi:ABC-type methionine transport system ATPase subunit
MFGSAAWRRHREARAQAAREHLVREVCARAAVREAESMVESAWIDGLDSAEQADPTARALLEREREAFARATRRRAAETENDRRRLAALTEAMTRSRRTVPPSE